MKEIILTVSSIHLGDSMTLPDEEGSSRSQVHLLAKLPAEKDCLFRTIEASVCLFLDEREVFNYSIGQKFKLVPIE